MTVKRTGGKRLTAKSSPPSPKHKKTKKKLTFEEFLFQLGLGDFDLDGAVNLLLVTALVVGVVLDRGREQSVDESRFAQSRLSSNLL